MCEEPRLRQSARPATTEPRGVHIGLIADIDAGVVGHPGESYANGAVEDSVASAPPLSLESLLMHELELFCRVVGTIGGPLGHHFVVKISMQSSTHDAIPFPFRVDQAVGACCSV